jgi:hypothetical protein
MNSTVKIFCCYLSKDQPLLNELKKNLMFPQGQAFYDTRLTIPQKDTELARSSK